MKVWCVACFRYVGAATRHLDLGNIYLFSSLELANKFLNGPYKKWDYDDYEIYESDVDIAD